MPAAAAPGTASYQHTEAQAMIRPEAGAQTRFKKKKPAATWRYDSSLAPELQWDALNPAREQGEARIAELLAALASVQATLADVQAQLAAAKPGQPATELNDLLHEAQARLARLQNEPLRAGRDAAAALKALSRPFLNWAGKAERLSFDVPTLPLFIHERLSTQAILNSISSHKKVRQGDWINDFFGHPERSLPEQLMKAYEHPNGWQNRMVLGDSLVVMNSLLHYENMGGSVQMIYIDPPYGVKFGSNFQPCVRKRDVTHNDDEAFTREPEMVKAYRDTWELGLHSYLTYLRDRLLLARELLTESGSVFVQISDENLHHVREVMDEVFGAENCLSIISFNKTTSASGELLATVNDFLLWFARDKPKVKTRAAYLPKSGFADSIYKYLELPNGEERNVLPEELRDPDQIPPGARIFSLDNITSPRPAGAGDLKEFTFRDKKFSLQKGTFKTDDNGLKKLAEANRLGVTGATLRYKRYVDDFPVKAVTNVWDDTSTGSFTESKVYAVQTGNKVIERCMLMTTDSGDLVIDPTCGSGTTAVVAES